MFVRKIICLVLVGILLCGSAFAFEHLDFADKNMAERLKNSFHGKYYVYFCEVCPSARRMMSTQVKNLSEALVKSKVPLELIVVTPGLSPKEVEKYASNVGVVGAHCAQDPGNRLKISLRNIIQFRLEAGKSEYEENESGKKKRKRRDVKSRYVPIDEIFKWVKNPDLYNRFGSFKYPMPATDNKFIKKLWWGLENNVTGSLSALSSKYKRAKPGEEKDDQIIKLYKRADSLISGAIETSMAGEDSFQTYLALEKALNEAKGFKKFDEAEKRFSKLKKNKLIKTELKAKDLYFKAEKMMASKNKTEKLRGEKTMEAISKKFPDTEYGKMASAKGK